MSTDVRKRWKPLDSGNAISASPAAARLPCPRSALLSRPSARGPSVRGAPPPSCLPQRPQPRAGPADPPRRGVGAEPCPQHGEGRAGPLLLRTHGVAEEALPLPRGAGPHLAGARAGGALAGGCVPSRPAEERGPAGPRGRGAPRSGIVFPVPGQLGGWQPVGGGAGRGRCGRKGKRRAPAPTQSHHTPPPRCGFAAATYGSVCKHAPRQQREKHKRSKF